MWTIVRIVSAIFVLLAFNGCERQETTTNEADTTQTADSTAGTKPHALAPECQLVMGWDPWEPYQYRTAQGDVSGLDVEIARAAAAAADCELELVEGQWMNLLGQLREGEINMLAGATRTPGREEFAEFTEPYRSESFLVYTHSGNEQLVATSELDALREGDFIIGTVAEYYYGDEISPVLDELDEAGRLREAAVAELNYERLLSGDIDAFIEDPFVAAAVIRKRGLTQIAPTDIRIDAADVRFMLSREGLPPESIARFSQGLEQIRANGQLEAILEKYR